MVHRQREIQDRPAGDGDAAVHRGDHARHRLRIDRFAMIDGSSSNTNGTAKLL